MKNNDWKEEEKVVRKAAVKNPKTVPAPRLKRVNPEVVEQSRARIREAIAGNKNVSFTVFRVSRFFPSFIFFLLSFCLLKKKIFIYFKTRYQTKFTTNICQFESLCDEWR